MEADNLRQAAAIVLTGVTLFFAACTKDVYEPSPEPTPDPTPSEEVSQELKDFGFSTQGDVKLSVNYHAQNLKVLFEVYNEYPLNEGGYSKKETAKPMFAAYTDVNGKYDGTMYIPTAVEKVYLYTSYYGFPKCVEAEVTATGVAYDPEVKAKGVTTRAASGYNWGKVVKFPCRLADASDDPMDNYRGDNLNFLYSWGDWGRIDDTKYSITNSVPGSNESADQFSRRIQQAITSLSVAERRSQLVKDGTITDIDVKEDGTTLEVVFLGDAAMYANTFGYYCYTEAEYNKFDFSLIRKNKYVVFPNASYLDSESGENGTQLVLEKGTTVKLKYIDADGVAHDEFPAGAKVGWYYGRNSFKRPNSQSANTLWELSMSTASFSTIDSRYDDIKDQRFIALKDPKTNILVLGFEDNKDIVADPTKADPGQEDYMDVLFYVKSNKNITENNPVLPDVPEEEEEAPVAIYQSGTLGFEDIWPSGGDYDLNDVAVEYTRTLKFNTSNRATGVVETFKFVQDNAAANFNNYFGFQADNLGSVDALNTVVEYQTNSVIIKKFAKNARGEEFVVSRDFNGSLDPNDVLKDFNPYIITNVTLDEGAIPESRKEVHLAMKKGTSRAEAVSGKVFESYYLDKSGAYPYAICVPVLGFELSPERQNIGVTYPGFERWSKSLGKTDKEWYFHIGE